MPDLHDLLDRQVAATGAVDLASFDTLLDRARRRRRRGAVLTAGVTAVVVATIVVPVVLISGRTDAGRVTPLQPPGVRDCGVDIQQGPVGEPISAAHWQCFVDALAHGDRAQLRVTMLTTEGDPVYVTYRTAGGGVAEVVTDTSRDRFAGTPDRVQSETCRQPDPNARGVFLDCSSPARVDSSPS